MTASIVNDIGEGIILAHIAITYLLLLALFGATDESNTYRVHLPVITDPRPRNDVSWTHLSSASGSLPQPGKSQEQTAALVFDVDGDGVNDFVIGSRKFPGPSVVWYKHTPAGWLLHVIDSEPLRIEAGGTFGDVDRDGDLDLILGGDGSSNEVWWWENPAPDFAAGKEWRRRLIKRSGETRHHDMLFGNFDGDAGAELVFWNQSAHALFMVDVPADPRNTQPWPRLTVIATVDDPPNGYHEALAQADVNGDGKMDLVGGGRWYEQTGHFTFVEHLIEDAVDTRMAVGQIIPGGRPEVVFSPGEISGMARWYEWNGSAWVRHDLLEVDMAHTLELGDIDGDGTLDIMLGEMRHDERDSRHNPDARTILLFNNGRGRFVPVVLSEDHGHHESRLADLDADGDLDILGKPYDWNTPRIDIWLNNRIPNDEIESGICGVGAWQWQTRVIDPSRPRRAVFVDAADLDGDDYPDIVSGAWWYRNPGTLSGRWTRAEIGSPLNQMAALADFDGDGDIDILGTIASGSEQQPQLGNAFVWARNDGAGNFTVLDNIDAGNGDFLQGVAIAQRAGRPAAVYLSWHRQDTLLQRLGLPADAAAERWTISDGPPSQSEALSLGDIDRDGDDDLLLGTRWLQADGPDSWRMHVLASRLDPPDRNALADINGDGRADAVVGYEAISRPGLVAWYEQPADDPTGLWTEHPIATVIGPMSLDVADVDGDGDPDVVVGEHNTANPTQARLLVFLNRNGRGTIWEQVVIDSGHEHHIGARTADLDLDGDLDIYSIGWAHGAVLVYEQVGCGQ